MFISTLQQAWILGVIAVLAGSLLGLASLWIVRTGVHWALRWLAVGLVLALPAAIPAPELVLLAMVEMAIVWLGMLVGRLIARRRSTGAAEVAIANEPHPLRFSLHSGFLAVGVAAIFFADLRLLIREPLRSWIPALILGAICGVVTLAAAWGAWGRGRSWLRCLLTLFVAMLCGVTFDLGAAGAILYGFDGSGGQFCLHGHWILTVSMAIVVAVIPCLRYRPPMQDPATGVPAPAPRQIWARAASIAAATPRRILSRAAGIAAILLMIGCLTPVYYELAKPTPIPAFDVPNPNAYPKLFDTAQRIRWAVIPQQDINEVTHQQLEQFAADNQKELSELHQLVRQPGSLNLTYTELDFDAARFSQLRDLALALSAEARLAFQDARDPECAFAGLKSIQLGDQVGRGGIQIDALLGIAFQGVGAHWIAKTKDFLDAKSRRELIRTLAALDQNREPFEVINARDHAWDLLAHGWQGRLAMITMKMTLPAYVAGTHPRFDPGKTNVTRTRLLIVELALREYVARHGEPPETLAQLVPECLENLPVDPYNEKPLCYRRDKQKWLLYSVGPDGVDNGGRFAWVDELNPGTDFFLDGCFPPDERYTSGPPTAADTTEEDPADPTVGETDDNATER